MSAGGFADGSVSHRGVPARIGRPTATECAALIGVLAAALALRLWGLQQNGWGADYYSAAVRSMAGSWYDFVHGSFDPAGFISVDKPPLALWLQVISVRLLGYSPFALLLPQVLAGVASVAVLYAMVRRCSGSLPAIVAALLFASTPVWIAVNRTNNTDSCLVLVLLLAGWALMRAAETGSRRALFVAMAGIGLAFNVKMLAAFVVLPAFALTYLLGDVARWRRRVADLALAGVVLVAASAPWALVYHLQAPDQRPFLGGSRDNSAAALILGHNARSRFVAADEAASPPDEAQTRSRRVLRQEAPALDFGDDAASSARTVVRRLFVTSPTGPLRVFGGQLAAQFAWWLPLAIVGVVAGLLRGRAAASAPPGPHPARARLALAFWLAWSATCVLVYGQLGGIVHFYYVSTLAPALAALAGAGAGALHRWATASGTGARALAAFVVLAAAWQFLVHANGLGWPVSALWSAHAAWLDALHLAVAGTALAASLLLLARSGGGPAPLARAGATLAACALLALPLGWGLSSVLLPGHGMLPSADLYRLLVATRSPRAIEAARLGQLADTARLARFLQANRSGERFLLATSTTRLAAPIIIATGEPVMARGGYHGFDAAVTPESLARWVREGKIRFAIVGDITPLNLALGGEAASRDVSEWIAANGTRVDRTLWHGAGLGRTVQLYDLSPGKPIVAAR